jgi:hypothetical protein
MYRGHILAEWGNIFDIADIDGNRRGGQDFFYPLYSIDDDIVWFMIISQPNYESGEGICAEDRKETSSSHM